MKRISRDGWITGTLFLLLLLLLTLGAVGEVRQREALPLVVTSAAPDGALALADWLATQGLAVDTRPQSAFAVPDDVDVALVLEPAQSIDDEAWLLLEAWVAQGGTLLLAGSGLAAQLAFDRLGLDLERLDEAPLRWTAPLLASPPPGSLAATADWGFAAPLPAGGLVHVQAGEAPLAVSLERGAGRIIAVSSAAIFTNSGLRQAGVPRLVLNLITGTGGAPQAVWFDGWHHGRRAAVPMGPNDWLRTTPAGRAVLLTGLLIFIALVLDGRRLGRPVPLPDRRRRRSPLEHVDAMANLSRRAGHRAALHDHYHGRLKRGLAARYHIDPALPDADFAARAAAADGALNQAALERLLRLLAGRTQSESELVEVARQVERILTARRPHAN